MWVEQVHSQKCARILQIKQPLLKTWQITKRTLRTYFENEIFFEPITAHEIIFDVLVAPLSQQFPRLDFQQVHSCDAFWRSVVPLHQLDCSLDVPAFSPVDAMEQHSAKKHR